MHWRGEGLSWKQSDPLLFIAALALGGLGLTLVTSATWRYMDSPSLLEDVWTVRHLAFLGVGILGMIGFASLPPRVYEALAYPVYAFSLATLVAVAILGKASAEHGALAQRWIEVGGVQLQPSEPAKVALVLVLAKLFAGGVPGLRRMLLSMAITGAPVMLVYLQPDLGSALCMIASWAGIVVLAGTPKKYVFAIGGLAVASMPLLWLSMRGYMRERVLTFLNPEAYALGEGYNVLQAQISIGSGGLWGKGLFEGTQTQLRYLRLSHSDFIFSVLGEELGFVGAMAVLLLFLFLLFRVLRAGDTGDGQFASLLCGGIASLIAFQTVANVGGNIGLTPVVGIPLPFLSHGGSSLITQFSALGLVQAALVHRRPYRFEV
ncbi:MAG: rod shape-determining protein RodA [Chloroflexi bacterium]|nr:rod shape-determining protein RodA [Chloroflexota bacterium]